MTRRKRFTRPLGNRRYGKRFVLATEGERTEPQYFNQFDRQPSNISVFCVRKPAGNAPQQVLRRMVNHLEQEDLRHGDEAWLIVDKDHWSDEQLGELHRWACAAPNWHLALSNPKFEYWLLLHFENGVGIGSARDCEQRLRRYLPDYRKVLDTRFTRTQIEVAVERARQRDQPPCADWPRDVGSTTVYRLVAGILSAQDAFAPS